MKNKFLTFLFCLISFSAMADSTSLYEAPMKWKNEFNKNFQMSELRGKKVIVAMAYTRCQIMCPLIISKVKKLEAYYLQKNIPIQVAVITFDPTFDTPERLHSYYRDEIKIKGDNWNFITGPSNQTRMMSMLLGIKYSINPKSKIIMHDNKLIVLDEAGKMEKRFESLDSITTESLN